MRHTSITLPAMISGEYLGALLWGKDTVSAVESDGTLRILEDLLRIHASKATAEPESRSCWLRVGFRRQREKTRPTGQTTCLPLFANQGIFVRAPCQGTSGWRRGQRWEPPRVPRVGGSATLLGSVVWYRGAENCDRPDAQLSANYPVPG
jgi:hypothetical protein